MSSMALVASDPSAFGWPPGLPVELAMRQARPSEICASYGLAKSDYDKLCADPGFLQALEAAVAMLAVEGASFRIKARIQAEELLKTSWKFIHDETDEIPASVKADLIKWTMRVAGVDASLDQKAAAQNAASQVNALQIVINLGDA